jgi:KipI family sensor histidine kinase inhibitor
VIVDFAAEPLAEDALLIRFGERIDPGINARVHAAAAALRAARPPGITDIAPAYASLMLRFDPFAWTGLAGKPHECVAASVRAILDAAIGSGQDPARHPGDRRPEGDGRFHAPGTIEIPVCYGGESGPDLAAVAAYAQLPPGEVIARHAAADYTVAMLGFAPGFPYLLGLEPALHVPRRATPRTRVPSGSVAIGGAQTGIYPRELPGGWNLIGRTPLELFDARRNPPALLAPGDRVRFRPVDDHAFAALARGQSPGPRDHG